MGLNLEKMRQKLSAISTTGRGNNDFWRPQEGENNVRIMPTSDGDPFKEFHFHYNVGNSGFLCPKNNYGDDCPVCNFASRLWSEPDEDSKKMAKSLFAKKRFFAPVLIRGDESEGVKVWGFGRMAYQKLLNIVLDPDYGDITDQDNGNDLKVIYEKLPGANFPTTDIRPRPRKTVLCNEAIGGDDRCAELLESVPEIDSLFERKTTREVQTILDSFLADGDGNDEVAKFGATEKPVDAPTEDSVENAFAELMGGAKLS